MTESGQRTNRLAHETSPYLLQHAGNPVDWYPWGEEAIARAREEDRPIFLSIGYSACHWCHVMEHESFEDESIAARMNRHFVNVKVDREERPDLDQIYMNSVVALTGRGGWPMSVFLTPELKPFYGGTYWPPTARMGMPGFVDVIERVAEAWNEKREDIERGAGELTSAVDQMSQPPEGAAELTEDLLRNAERVLVRAADRTHGGFGAAPKFPHPMDLGVLLRCAKRFGSEEARNVVTFTLHAMASGGIYDHLGGGFHRYSTDARWLVPHFEKMLYDNALLVPVYLEAFQLGGRDADARVVRETLDYVLREMTQPEGGFYSTQDADSEGEEGKFFVWTEAEILEHLGPEDGKVFAACYDVTPGGNWEGKTILNRPKPHAESAEDLGIPQDELEEILGRCRRTLFEVRSQRVAPGRDDKVLVSWNGLMIAAMAQAGRVLGEDRYTNAAVEAARFLLENLRDEQGRLLHAYKDGRSRFDAYLDDYACLVDGLVECYQSTFDATLLDEALKLAEEMVERFADQEGGGFFYTAADHEQLITRTKDAADNATPSGNGMAATALLKLGRLTARTDLEDHGERTLRLLSGQLQKVPLASGQSLQALDFHVGPAREVVVAAGSDPEETERVLETLRSRFLPNVVVALRPADGGDESLPESVRTLLQGKSSREGRTAVYACERGVCHEPVVGAEAVEETLREW